MLLFGCADCGPAKYISLIARNFPNSLVYCSDLNKHLFNNINIKQIKDLSILNNIELVITGTSLGTHENSIDKQLIIWAKKSNIKCISIIEHWYWYIKRFEDDGEINLPDYVIVNDKLAEKQAIKEGIPKDIIKSLGNPYLESLSKKKEKFSLLNKDLIRNKYGVPIDKKTICFISESLSNLNEKNKEFIGYDEFRILDDLIKNYLTNNEFLIIKLHPEEKKDKYKKYEKDNIICIDDCDLSELIIISDHVVGMHSMLLLELSIFRSDIISIRPSSNMKFIGQELEIVVSVSNVDELKYVINSKKKSKNNFDKFFYDSEKRIVRFIKELCCATK